MGQGTYKHAIDRGPEDRGGGPFAYACTFAYAWIVAMCVHMCLCVDSGYVCVHAPMRG
jgi:hypothetical protein